MSIESPKILAERAVLSAVFLPSPVDFSVIIWYDILKWGHIPHSTAANKKGLCP